MKNLYYYQSDIGKIALADDGKAITNLFFGEPKNSLIFTERQTPLIIMAYEQLTEYFNGKRQTFSLPLEMRGTVFQRMVWNALLTIPYGEMCSYQEIAQRIGSPKAFRAVGLANNRNPLPIFVPCHRVIGKNGTLVGYGGGLPIKEQLLALEKRVKNSQSPVNG